MTKSLLNIIFLFILITFFSCKTKKEVTKVNPETNEMNYVFSFHEATKLYFGGFEKEAQTMYFKALEYNPKSAVCNYYLAQIYFRNGDFDTALNFSKSAVSLNSANNYYKILEADILFKMNKLDEAAKVFEELISKNPNERIYYKNLSEIRFQQKNYEEFIKIYETINSKFDYDENVIVSLVKLYSLYRSPDFRLNFINNLIKSDSNNYLFKLFLAEYYSDLKDFTKANEIYASLYETYKKDYKFLDSYLNFTVLAGKQSQFYTGLIDLLSVSEAPYLNKANRVINFIDSQTSKEQNFIILKTFFENFPDSVLPNALFSEYYINSSEFIKAEVYLRKAAKISGNDFSLVLSLFELEMKNQNYDSLYSDSEFFTDYFPLIPDIYQYKGFALFRLKQYEKAIEILQYGNELIIDNNNQKAVFHYYIAEVYRSLNDNALSDFNFEQMILLNTNFFVGINNYAFYLAKRNENLEYAKSLAQKCLKSNQIIPSFFDTNAWIFFKLKDYKSAQYYSETALKSDLGNPVFNEHLGDIFFMIDDDENALKYWNISLELFSENDILIKQILNYNILSKQEFYNKYLITK